MKELADINQNLEDRIISLIESGNVLSSENNFILALECYQKAWDLLPEPKLGWEMISAWLSGSFYTVYFKLAEFERAKAWAEFQYKATSSDIDTAPLIDLGMVCFELGELDEAYKYLHKAYDYGKKRAFQERPKKYLDFYLEKSKEN